MPANDNARPQIRLRLTEAEARQIDDARAAFRLSRADLVRLAIDDLLRGPRFKCPTSMRSKLITGRKPVPAIAA